MSSKGRTTDSDMSASSSPEIGRSMGWYLLAVHRLSGTGENRITTGELQQSLDVSAPSVSEMISKLNEKELVDYEKYRGVTLTLQGDVVATRLAWRFCVVTNFFGSVLNTNLDDETSYEISFALPEDGIFGLQELIDHPCREECPKAKPGYAGCPV